MKTIKTLIVLTLTLTLSACGAPVTKTIELSKDELRQEEQHQKEMYAKHRQEMRQANKPRVHGPKHSMEYHTKRLTKVANKLHTAADKIFPQVRAYDFRIEYAEELNAYADGNTIYITPTMLDYLETEQELAIILAHEMSHNIMLHLNKKTGNMLVGCALDIATAVFLGVDTGGTLTNVGASAYSQNFENEADYIGAYILANAGYNVDTMGDIWRKMALNSPQNSKSNFFSTHPSHSERYLRMKKVAAEIKEKRAKKLALRPEFNQKR